MHIQRERNHLVNLLRFFAASAVVLFHFNEPIAYIPNIYRHLCKFGYLGVPVFFVISGYCIKIAQNHSKSARRFIIRRLFRIFPPYWFSVALVCLCAIGQKLVTGTNSVSIPKDIGSIFSIIVLYTSPLSHVTTINWVFWTLPYELFFYLIIGATMLFGENIRRVALVVLLITAIFLPVQVTGFLFFFNELPTFLLGYTLFLVLNKTDIFTLTMVMLAIVTVIIKHRDVAYLVVCLTVCLLILLDKIKPLKNNFFSKLGDYSYSIYLIHVPIGIFLLGFIKGYAIVQTNIYLNIIADFAMLSWIIFISKFTFEWIELKSIQLGKRFAK